ncbi:hypothetical protein [Psychroflexus sediminis]|nr:hypothetical protein [Psychroflexus sediminis]
MKHQSSSNSAFEQKLTFTATTFKDYDKAAVQEAVAGRWLRPGSNEIHR